MNKKKTIYLYNTLTLVLFTLFFTTFFSPKLVLSDAPFSETKTESSIEPLYSFTNSIEYFEISKNGSMMVIKSSGNKTDNAYVYSATSSGTDLKLIFSPGYYLVGKQELYFSAKKQLPSISSSGRYICMGVQCNNPNATRKVDYVFFYDSLTKKSTFFPLRILVPGTNQAFVSESLHNVPSVDIGSNEEQIVVQIETVYQENSKTWLHTAIIVMDKNGANQTLAVGPKEFSRIQKEFVFKNHIHSPHLPRFASNNTIAFFAQLFENQSPVDKKGEIFTMNLDTNFVQQITSSRRFDPKPEEFGPFVLNMYGTKIFYKNKMDERVTVFSISITGSENREIIPISTEDPFCISGDGNRIFYVDTKNQNSLVYYDISRKDTCFIIDKTETGKPFRQTIYRNINKTVFPLVSRIGFEGSSIPYLIHNNVLARLHLIQSSQTSRNIRTVFQKNRSTVFINDQAVSISSPPYIENNRMMIPLSIVANYFGMQYFPDLTKGIIQIQYNGNYYKFVINNNDYLLNGLQKPLPGPIVLHHNEPFFLASSVEALFSFSIQWDSQTETLIIKRGL